MNFGREEISPPIVVLNRHRHGPGYHRHQLALVWGVCPHVLDDGFGGSMSRYSVVGRQSNGDDKLLGGSDTARGALTYASAGQKLFRAVTVRDNVAGRDLTLPELRALAGREK